MLHKLFTKPAFSMYWVQLIAFVIYILTMLAYAELFHDILGVSAWKSCLFFLTVMFHAIWVEQFYFAMQIMEIALGMLLTAITLRITFTKRGLFWDGCVILLLVLIMSTYQSLSIIYVAGVITCFLLLQGRYGREEPGRITCFIKIGIRQTGLFSVAFLVNTVITKQFFSSSDYLSGQVRWGTDSAAVCVGRIMAHIKQVLTGTGSETFYNWTFTVSLVLAATAMICFLKKAKLTAADNALVMLAFCVLQSTPFLLTVYGGKCPVFRAQMVLPFVIACNVLLVLSFMADGWLRVAATGAAALMLANNLYTACQLEYTWRYVRNQDEQRAFQISEEIQRTAHGANKPVAFIGYYPAKLNKACITGEITHQSVFEFGGWSETRYSDSTGWIVGYLKSLGNACRPIEDDRMSDARRYAADMPCWPDEGSVREFDDFIVVKLSPDDFYASDLMEAAVSQTQLSKDCTLEWDETTMGWIDLLEVEDDVLTVNGWVFRKGCDSTYAIPRVHLLDESTQTLYTLASGSGSREDLNEVYPDGTEYGHSGIFACASISDLPVQWKDCRVLLSVTIGEHTYFTDASDCITYHE